MFTGIITAMGTIAKVDETRGDKRFVIDTPWNMNDVLLGHQLFVPVAA